ncbi:A/G-specific adenine glycosylase [Thiohalospira sp.]|uniref:A/G-specific adenine glycosylase n=1 Tax=Thiohalospira sp. TaxID=3080549 RepID=UPI003980FA94
MSDAPLGTGEPVPDFADRLLAWFDAHGRHDLPWQHPRTAYRVWVAEVMLQQTRVATVIPYFEAFMAAFPDVVRLADADQGSVLERWAGLGYYARARNLHAAARIVRDDHGGHFPAEPAALAALPGIGPSTANAIAAQAFDRPAAILDGNVKRVLARLHGVEGWPGATATARRLWRFAKGYTPDYRAADYTQAIMDLGATLCTRARPACDACPFAGECTARAEGRTAELPHGRPRKGGEQRRRRETAMLLIRDEAGRVLLVRRPPTGIWGGLWSLPEAEPGAEREAARALGLTIEPGTPWEPLEHTFTHFDLAITPVPAQVRSGAGLNSPASGVMEGEEAIWYNGATMARPGVPAPVATLLARIETDNEVPT